MTEPRLSENHTLDMTIPEGEIEAQSGSVTPRLITSNRTLSSTSYRKPNPNQHRKNKSGRGTKRLTKLKSSPIDTSQERRAYRKRGFHNSWSQAPEPVTRPSLPSLCSGASFLCLGSTPGSLPCGAGWPPAAASDAKSRRTQ